MGVLGRMNDIVRSNLNELVSKAENPEKLLKQAILDMEAHLRQARKQVIDTIAAEKMLEKKRLAVLETAHRWQRRTEMALRANDEDLARQALIRKADFDAQAEQFENQILVQREYVGALKQSLASLEERHREARARKDALIARARTAKARKKTAEAVTADKLGGGIKEARAFDTFERMEDKVLELEAKAEAFLEVAEGGEIPAADPGLDARFQALEKGQDLDDQLARLKQQIDDGEPGQ